MKKGLIKGLCVGCTLLTLCMVGCNNIKSVKVNEDNQGVAVVKEKEEQAILINPEELVSSYKQELMGQSEFSEMTAMMKDFEQDGIDELLVIGRPESTDTLVFQIYEYDAEKKHCYLSNQFEEQGLGSNARAFGEFALYKNQDKEYLFKCQVGGDRFDTAKWLQYDKGQIKEIVKCNSEITRDNKTLKTYWRDGEEIDEKVYDKLIEGFEEDILMVETKLMFYEMIDHLNGGQAILGNDDQVK